MSLYRSTYLGVYLLVDQYLEVDYNERECGNNHRHRISSRDENKFCSECGNEIKLVKKTNKRRMTCDDAVEEFGFENEDDFFNVDQGDKPHIWISNSGGNSVDDEQGAHEVTPEDIHNAVHAFFKAHAAELKLLDDNDVDYAMLYGLVTYYN